MRAGVADVLACHRVGVQVAPPLLGARFIFATGIECSYPTVTGPDGTSVRVDELERTSRYRRPRDNLALVRDLGLGYLRYDPPYQRAHRAPDDFDWEFTDLAFAEMRRLAIVPIADLCHVGVPDWVGDFQNPDWPALFARYAAAFAARFPWVRFYTPVNEIYVCAKLSTLDGIWNERRRGDAGAGRHPPRTRRRGDDEGPARLPRPLALRLALNAL